ncbi:hypothetical protein Poly51_26470 [Rubripirellula tenax]|uniref:Uncharacterized protein n=1 Tax=Rubripirellula tenax TaxID=2528015 RepID=A0A5C6F816_9BACT|nr:hypothetical protein Poly51_26470 [Rubripirellula tenax]
MHPRDECITSVDAKHRLKITMWFVIAWDVIDPPLVVATGLPVSCCHATESRRLPFNWVVTLGIGHFIVKGEVHSNLSSC